MNRVAQTLNRAVDWTLGIVSPNRARRRLHLRMMEHDPDYRATFLAVMRSRGYRSAESPKSASKFKNASGSADAQILGDLPALRERNRELNRDDPIASGLSGTFVKNVIGTGMRPQARTANPEKNRRIEAVFKERRDQLSPDRVSYGQQQRMKFAKTLEDGDVLVKSAKAAPLDPVFFETVEGERIATPNDPPLSPGHTIREGVERDAFGRVAAWWVLKKHPGDGIGAAFTRQWRDFERVEASRGRHLKLNANRPGQSRGVPVFHAILQDLRDLDLLIVAALKRTQVAACVAAFITSSQGTNELFEVTAERYGYRLDQDLEPGMIFRLYPGEQVSSFIPNFPTPELDAFIVMLARRIGAALGVSWQIVLKDFSKANYSSARTDLLEARQSYTLFQDWFQEELLDWEWFTVLEDAKLRGDPRLADCTPDDFRAVQWIGNGWRWVDPLKEAKATESEMKLGITTLRDVAASRGQDWEELLEQQALEAQKREALGLPSLAEMLNVAANDPQAIAEGAALLNDDGKAAA